MGKIKELLKKLDRHLTQERQSHPHDASASGWLMFGHHKVHFFFSKCGCDVEVFNITKDRLLENVANYCSKHCLDWEDIDVDLEVSDFWNEHGFANEADYIRYRYG